MIYYTAIFGQTIEKWICAMADGRHFKFLPTTKFPHTFQRDIPSNFFLKPSKKTKQLRKEPSLSTVTDVHQMTQLLLR